MDVELEPSSLVVLWPYEYCKNAQHKHSENWNWFCKSLQNFQWGWKGGLLFVTPYFFFFFVIGV